MKTAQSPYRCHIFVCVNDRQGARKSCADGDSAELRLRLKEHFRDRRDIRVSQSLCMGLCDAGPNLLIYPQGIWLSEAKLEDLAEITRRIEDLLK